MRIENAELRIAVAASLRRIILNSQFSILNSLLILFAFPLFGQAPQIRSVVEPEAAIGQRLTLRVDGKLPDCKTLVLFIQRSPIRSLPARCGAGTVAFNLAVTDKNADKWHRILGGHWVMRTVTVGLGENPQLPYRSEVSQQPLRVIRLWRLLVILLVMLLLFAAIFVVRTRTSYLDTLPRMQIALWVVVIVASYAYIWCVTGETETINGTALALLAIGSGTAAGSALMANAKAMSAKALVQGLQNLDSSDLTPVESAGPGGLQAVIMGTWTVLLGIVFVVSVFRFLAMPAFSSNVLAILGIVGGTYVAFAMPSRH